MTSTLLFYRLEFTRGTLPAFPCPVGQLPADRCKHIACKASPPKSRRDIRDKEHVFGQRSRRAFREERPPPVPSAVDMFAQALVCPVFIVLCHEVPEAPAHEFGKEALRIGGAPETCALGCGHEREPLALTATDEPLGVRLGKEC
jgi:hypothetical protein